MRVQDCNLSTWEAKAECTWMDKHTIKGNSKYRLYFLIVYYKFYFEITDWCFKR